MYVVRDFNCSICAKLKENCFRGHRSFWPTIILHFYLSSLYITCASEYQCVLLIGHQLTLHNTLTTCIFYYVYMHTYLLIKNLIAKAIIYYNPIWKPNHLTCYTYEHRVPYSCSFITTILKSNVKWVYLFWLMCTYTCMIYQLPIKYNCLLKITKS